MGSKSEQNKAQGVSLLNSLGNSNGLGSDASKKRAVFDGSSSQHGTSEGKCVRTAVRTAERWTELTATRKSTQTTTRLGTDR